MEPRVTLHGVLHEVTLQLHMMLVVLMFTDVMKFKLKGTKTLRGQS